MSAVEVNLDQVFDGRDGWDGVRLRDILLDIASDPVLIEIARKDIEAQLIELQNMHASIYSAGNDIGSSSSYIHISTPDAVVIALKAIATVSSYELDDARERYRQARESREQ